MNEQQAQVARKVVTAIQGIREFLKLLDSGACGFSTSQPETLKLALDKMRGVLK